MANCNICFKRVLSHSRHIQCKNCNDLIHINCLPFIKPNDPLYTERHVSDWYCIKCSADIFPFNHFSEEDEFLLALSDYWFMNEIMGFNELKLQNKLFTPFELNENENSPLYDIDPDMQFYVNQSNSYIQCVYFIMYIQPKLI